MRQLTLIAAWKSGVWLAAWTLTTVLAYALGLAISLGLTGGGFWLMFSFFTSNVEPSKHALALLVLWSIAGPGYLLTMVPVFVMLGGVLCGLLQQVVLRRRISDLAGWPWTICFGWLVSVIIGAGLWWLIATPTSAIFAIAGSCGLILGATQRGALPVATPISKWWIPLMIGVVLLGTLAGWSFWQILHTQMEELTGWCLSGGVAVLVAALLSGVAILLIPHTRPVVTQQQG